jgi:hypothetical protein
MSAWDENKKTWVPERPIIECSDDIRDVMEGPIVGALVSVFDQLEKMGAKRHGRDQ